MMANLFTDLPPDLPDELCTTLLDAPDARIERIVSHGQTSDEGFWYDQDQHEWVVVLKGAARLEFEDGMVEMKPGDFVNIPAHKKHRVEWTTPDEPTIWLAMFYGEALPAERGVSLDEERMVNFEKKGFVSLWAFMEEPPEHVDLMQELCGVDYYDLDDQEGNFAEGGKLMPLPQLISELSYADSFLDEAIRAATELRIAAAREVMAQFDFDYDPTRILRPAAPDPVFIGSFAWHN